MKYLCAIYLEERMLATMPMSDYQGVVRQCFVYEDELRKTGQLIAAEALEPTPAATTVQVRNNIASITDGPFAETKEQLAGFFLVDAANLDEALRIASGMPQARIGKIEVRPLRDLYQHLRAE
jgi:hypothetical protein